MSPFNGKFGNGDLDLLAHQRGGRLSMKACTPSSAVSGQPRGSSSPYTGSSPITSRCPSRLIASAMRGSLDP